VGEFLQLSEVDGTHLTVLKGEGVTGVQISADSVQAKHFPGHLKAGDLFPAIE
jgi:hypothetical protein